MYTNDYVANLKQKCVQNWKKVEVEGEGNKQLHITFHLENYQVNRLYIYSEQLSFFFSFIHFCSSSLLKLICLAL